MKAKIYSSEGAPKGEIELSDAVFNIEPKQHLLHQVVTSYLANQRQGTAKAKGRAEVSGGGKKPWRQKGTGHARSGSNTSPVWVRGGKAFGPEPRDYTQAIPKKMRRLALRSALSERARNERVKVLDSLAVEQPKTKMVADILKKLEIAGTRTLLVIDEGQRSTYLSARNIKNLCVKPVSQINAYDVLGCENVIFGSEDLVKKVEEAVAK